MMDFVDLHSHILPGLDDGAGDLADTVEMLRIAHRGGTRTMVATPHLFHPAFATGAGRVWSAYERLMGDLERLRTRPDHAFLDELTVLPGAENRLSPELFEAVEAGQAVTLNDGRHLLLEFPGFLAYEVMRGALERLRAADLVPVVAHVERYPALVEEPARIAELRTLGCRIQVNAGTLTEGGRAAKAVAGLLAAGRVDAVASDGHGPHRRRPDLGPAARKLRNRYGRERVRQWLSENPRRMLYEPAAGE